MTKKLSNFHKYEYVTNKRYIPNNSVDNAVIDSVSICTFVSETLKILSATPHSKINSSLIEPEGFKFN